MVLNHVKLTKKGEKQMNQHELEMEMKQKTEKIVNGLKNKGRKTVIAIIAVFVAIIIGPKLFETVSVGTYQTKQTAIWGNMYAKMTPGIWFQLWGDIKEWPKAFTFFFTHDVKEGEDYDQSIEVRFVDGSKCNISGTARVHMPTNEKDAIALIDDGGYENWREVQDKLVLPTIRNALRMTANMMTAQESYASKRIDYNTWARSQIEQGLYQTEDEVREIVDLVSGEKVKKTFKIIKKDKNGQPIHLANPLAGTGISLKNFEIKSFEYAPKVKEQISKQQESLMAVATAKADAQKAEQQKLTIEAEGKAKVAKAKYEEEQVKARAVVVAEREKEVQELNAARDKQVAVIGGEKRKQVAKLDKEAAELTKKKNILDGEGIAAKKKLILQADGALAQKLETYEIVMKQWADAYSKRPVPAVVMGGSKNKSGTDTDAIQMSEVLSLMALKQLGLDLNVPKK